MNLQPVDNIKDSGKDQDAWRNSHIIRFSQIDGAGIVYYPRYIEMLADSFPQQFSAKRPAQFDISFHHPARLGEKLLLEVESTTPTSADPKSPDPIPPETVPAALSNEAAGTGNPFTVAGKSAGELCFRLHQVSLQPTATARWPIDRHSFVRQVEIRDWMTGANGRMHLSRSYELTAVLMEEWFTKSLACPFATTQSSGGVLVPTVKLQTEVLELPSLGETVQVSLVVTHIGGSSLGLGMTVMRNGQLLLQTRQTVVFVAFQNNQMSSAQIPSHLLPKLNSQLIAAGT